MTTAIATETTPTVAAPAKRAKPAAASPVAKPESAARPPVGKKKAVAPKKPAAAPKAAAQAKPVKKKAAKAEVQQAQAEAKAPKLKLVRDSFAMPKAEYAVLDVMKLRCAKLGAPAKKSELLRAALKTLAALSDKELLAAVAAVPNIKTGRPPKRKD